MVFFVSRSETGGARELPGGFDLSAGRGREVEGPTGGQTQPNCKNVVMQVFFRPSAIFSKPIYTFLSPSGGLVLRGRTHHDDDRVGDTDRDDGQLHGAPDTESKEVQ